MATAMNIDSAATAASGEPIPTPSMVAERPVGEIPAGARAYFQPMINATRAEIMKEIATEFDKSMQTNFVSLNNSNQASQQAMKTYMDNTSSEIIQKFDARFNAKSVETEKQIKALEEKVKETSSKLNQGNGGTK